MPKENTAPMPGTKSDPGLRAIAEAPSGAAAKARTSKTRTARNSRPTRTPRTFAERSTRFTPSQATTAMQAKTGTHHGTVTPSLADSMDATVNPNSP